MKTDPVEPADPLNLLRQQLILAQVRIMELEDVRDELAPRLADVEKLLAAAQSLADQKAEESGHLAKTRSDLQAQYEYLRHMQHVTNEALNDTRRQLDDVTRQLTVSQQRNGQLQRDSVALTDQIGQLTASLQRVSRELDEENAIAMARLIRGNELDAELRAIKASRSWRWTRWLRSLERSLSGGRP
jgi:chromosome segregation ATPase